MTRIICVRGVGEPMVGNMLSGVTKLIPGAQVTELVYPASYGMVPLPFGMDADAAVAQGELALHRDLDTHGPAIVLGYSLGAWVAGNVAAKGHRNIQAVGLLADPAMPKMAPSSTRWGITGARPVGGNTRWWANPGDPICQAPADSPLRTIADQTARMSLRDPGRWAVDLIDRLARRRWQRIARRPWDFPAINRAYDEAGRQARGYLDGSAHVGAYYPMRAEMAAWVRSL